MATSLSIILYICTAAGCSDYSSNTIAPQTQPSCIANGYRRGIATGKCNTSDCCQEGVMYPQYYCSPAVTSETEAIMVMASFAAGGDGGGATECDSQYHNDSELVVSLSTGWYDDGRRCLKRIKIVGNSRSVDAVVVDECDSVYGCEADEGYMPPCPNNYVVASPAVWKALEIPADVGQYNIVWSDV